MGRESRQRECQISGILNIAKPAGMTSHDVVAAIRRASGERHVGHAGALDPMATGVLLICLGQATRVAEYLMASEKRYTAWMHLGVTTDTYDATGTVVSQASELSLSLADIARATRQFVGCIAQVPPMYSALKRQGQPLYYLARQGKEVEREPRIVQVYRFEIKDWFPPILVADIVCSKGTYVRSLAHDLGQALGCGAHLARLVRTASGVFQLDEAVELDVALQSFRQGRWRNFLQPLDVALQKYPAWKAEPETARRIGYGQAVDGPPWLKKPEEGALCRAYTPEGRLLALLQFDSARSLWRPAKVFAANTLCPKEQC